MRPPLPTELQPAPSRVRALSAPARGEMAPASVRPPLLGKTPGQRSLGASGQWPGGRDSLQAQGRGPPPSTVPSPGVAARRSDQGDFGLEAGGTARAGADAGQHGHLRAARGPVAASRGVMVFELRAQDALQVPAPPLPPQLRLHLGKGRVVKPAPRKPPRLLIRQLRI